MIEASDTHRSSSGQSGRGTFLLVLLAVAVVASVLLPMWTMSRMSEAKPVSSAELSQAAPGREVDVALEVTSAEGAQSFQGKVLEKVDGSAYRRTPTFVRVRWQADTPVVMGSGKDVVAGAVLMARGTTTADESIDANRIVILTGYVKVR
jgi:hypothetical protein